MKICKKVINIAQFICRVYAKNSDFSVYASSSIVLNISTLIATMLALRWVQPEAMGIWQSLLVAQSYLNIIRLGILNGMNRELPFLLGKKQLRTAYEVASTAQLHAIICAVIGFTVFVIAAFYTTYPSSAWYIGLGASGVSIASNFYLSYILATFRSQKEFRQLAYLQLIEATLILTLPIFAYQWGFTGYCIQIVGKEAIVCIIAFLIRPVRVLPKFYYRSFRLLLATGLPLFITNYAFTLAAGFDRVILSQLVGIEAVGYYTPSRAVLSAMTVVPSAIATYVYPKMSFQLGRMAGRPQLRSISLSAMTSSFLLGIPVALMGWFVIPSVVELAFPNYTPGLDAMRISLVSGLMLSVTSGTTVLASLKSWQWLYTYAIIYMSAMWYFPWSLSQADNPVTGVANGYLLASLVIAVSAIVITFCATRSHQDTTKLKG